MLLSWKSRQHEVPFLNCDISVDGTDRPILEPSPFRSICYSHIFKSAGIRYQLGISVGSWCIAWLNGGFPCCANLVLNTFRSEMKNCLLQNEKDITDDG